MNKLNLNFASGLILPASSLNKITGKIDLLVSVINANDLSLYKEYYDLYEEVTDGFLDPQINTNWRLSISDSWPNNYIITTEKNRYYIDGLDMYLCLYEIDGNVAEQNVKLFKLSFNISDTDEVFRESKEDNSQKLTYAQFLEKIRQSPLITEFFYIKPDSSYLKLNIRRDDGYRLVFYYYLDSQDKGTLCKDMTCEEVLNKLHVGKDEISCAVVDVNFAFDINSTYDFNYTLSEAFVNSGDGQSAILIKYSKGDQELKTVLYKYKLFGDFIEYKKAAHAFRLPLPCASLEGTAITLKALTGCPDKEQKLSGHNISEFYAAGFYCEELADVFKLKNDILYYPGVFIGEWSQNDTFSVTFKCQRDSVTRRYVWYCERGVPMPKNNIIHSDEIYKYQVDISEWLFVPDLTINVKAPGGCKKVIINFPYAIAGNRALDRGDKYYRRVFEQEIEIEQNTSGSTKTHVKKIFNDQITCIITLDANINDTGDILYESGDNFTKKIDNLGWKYDSSDKYYMIYNGTGSGGLTPDEAGATIGTVLNETSNSKQAYIESPCLVKSDKACGINIKNDYITILSRVNTKYNEHQSEASKFFEWYSSTDLYGNKEVTDELLKFSNDFLWQLMLYHFADSNTGENLFGHCSTKKSFYKNSKFKNTPVMDVMYLPGKLLMNEMFSPTVKFVIGGCGTLSSFYNNLQSLYAEFVPLESIDIKFKEFLEPIAQFYLPTGTNLINPSHENYTQSYNLNSISPITKFIRYDQFGLNVYEIKSEFGTFAHCIEEKAELFNPCTVFDKNLVYFDNQFDLNSKSLVDIYHGSLLHTNFLQQQGHDFGNIAALCTLKSDEQKNLSVLDYYRYVEISLPLQLKEVCEEHLSSYNDAFGICLEVTFKYLGDVNGNRTETHDLYIALTKGKHDLNYYKYKGSASIDPEKYILLLSKEAYDTNPEYKNNYVKCTYRETMSLYNDENYKNENRSLVFYKTIVDNLQGITPLAYAKYMGDKYLYSLKNTLQNLK